jgi:hypothetical protein
MKKFLLTGFIVLSLCNGSSVKGVQQQLPTAISDDAELMFDEIPDALDAVTSEDCDCSPVRASDTENPTLLQSCYQTALMYLFVSYLSLKYSCESAKQYMASLLAWAPATAAPAPSASDFSASVSE